jgi:hypothetical protein
LLFVKDKEKSFDKLKRLSVFKEELVFWDFEFECICCIEIDWGEENWTTESYKSTFVVDFCIISDIKRRCFWIGFFEMIS